MATEDGKDHRSRRDRDRDAEYREKEKHRSEKEKDRYKEKSRDKERDRDRERDERDVDRDDRDGDRDRDRHKEKLREWDRGRERGREREKHWEEREDYDRDRDREREREREKKVRDRDEREREPEREREDYDREKEKRSREREEREREREVHDREREREKEKKAREREEKERDREEIEREDIDRDRDLDREREKEKRAREKDREDRERDREREKEKRAREREDREREKERARRREEKEREREERERRRREEERERERDKERKRREVDREQEREADRDRKRRKRETEERESESHRKSNSHEQDLEEEQKRLDEEMEKRRRRVQEWQELRRKKEELERENRGENTKEEEQPNTGKNWTLEGESDEEEDDKKEMEIDSSEKENVPNGTLDREKGLEQEQQQEEEEIDPLDAFMNSMVLPEVEKLQKEAENSILADSNETKKGQSDKKVLPEGKSAKSMGRIIPGDDSDSDYADLEKEETGIEDEDDEDFMKRVKKTKAEKLAIVDHSKINYPPFRKSFYIEVKEITKMPLEEVADYRKQLELKVHGKDVPKPIKSWVQSGLTSKLLDTIRKLNFEKPMPIQVQALPIIMSGRDCIGVAKTGSGKTLAFVLPMLRHIKDQPPVVPGDGPIGLVMAPTRELVQQIHSDIKKFSKSIGVTCVAVYGGSGVAQQISDLKRGAEIVVCTPGRMIDILCTSGGKITNLRRVTFLVMDEADRMFDMGFEPQITRIIQNMRPDRQTVLFSATFPRQVEILARRVLTKPIEIQVGGRSVVNKDITQLVEVRPENERFLRLLELLGEWSEKGKILVFVHSQDKCDQLFKDLLKHGYPCLSLHGAKDQTDRESTISDFKSNVCNLLIATSVAARGLDVKELELVVNFDVPNHYEDYVHRVGRTGRAGRKGFAVTFISEEEERYAPDLVKALELSEQSVPSDLKTLADNFMAKVKQGTEIAHGTGYGGTGFKFNEAEDEARKAVKKAQLKEYGYEDDKSDSDSDSEEGVRKVNPNPNPILPLPAISITLPGAIQIPVTLPSSIQVPGTVPGTIPGVLSEAKAAALVAAMNLQANLAKIQANALPEHYEAELEINDFPQNARWRITHKDTIGPISEWTGAAITTRGQYYPPGKIVGPGERKLYLFIEGPTESSVKKAKAELKRVLEDCSNLALNLPGSAQPGKYSVI